MSDPTTYPTMAAFRDIEVVVQRLDPTSRTWHPLEEADNQHTLKAEKNSAAIRTVVLETQEGRFRFMIRVSARFKWGTANGLIAKLTFDQGWRINEYPVAIFKPEVDVLRLFGKMPAGIGTLQVSEVDSKLEYILETIALPENMAKPEGPWCNTRFEFRKLAYISGGAKSRPYVSTTDLARLRVVVQPRRIFRDPKPRLISLPSRPDEKARASSRDLAAKKGITLRTAAMKYKAQDQPVPQVCQIPSTRIAPHEPRTFVFLYREPGHYDKINDVELIDHTRAKAAAPFSDCSSAQLSDSLCGSDHTSDVENQTPIYTRRSTNRSSPSTRGCAESLPTPFSSVNNSRLRADSMNVSARQEVTDNASSANLVNEQNRKAGTMCFAVRDGLRAISNNTSLPSDRTLDTEEDTIIVNTDNWRSQQEDEPTLALAPTLTPLTPPDQPAQAWSPPESQERAERLRHLLRLEDNIQAERLKAASQDLQRREEIRKKTSFANNKIDELERQMQELCLQKTRLVQHVEVLSKEDADIASRLAVLSRKSQGSADVLDQEESEAFQKIEKHQLEELAVVKNVSESATKARKRRRSECSAGSTPNRHRATKRHASEKSVDGHSNGVDGDEGRRADNGDHMEGED